MLLGAFAFRAPVVVGDLLLVVQQSLDFVDVLLLNFVVQRLFPRRQLIELLLGFVECSRDRDWICASLAPTFVRMPSRYRLRNSLMLRGELLALAVLVAYSRYDTRPTKIPLANTKTR